MTLTAFRKRAEAAFKRSNPGAVVTAWIYPPRRVKYPTGFRGLYGRLEVTDGEAAGTMVAEYDAKYGLSVRGWGPSRPLVTP